MAIREPIACALLGFCMAWVYIPYLGLSTGYFIELSAKSEFLKGLLSMSQFWLVFDIVVSVLFTVLIMSLLHRVVKKFDVTHLVLVVFGWLVAHISILIASDNLRVYFEGWDYLLNDIIFVASLLAAMRLWNWHGADAT